MNPAYGLHTESTARKGVTTRESQRERELHETFTRSRDRYLRKMADSASGKALPLEERERRQSKELLLGQESDSGTGEDEVYQELD